MASIKDLYDFIERAERSRKYPTSTAQGLKAAINIFNAELNDDEKGSLDIFKQNIDQIYQSVFNKNKSLTASSLATYKSRALKTISDYEKYGTDATKMSNWSPKVQTRVKHTDKQSMPTSAHDSSDAGQPEVLPIVSRGMHKLELALRPDVKFILIVPYDLRNNEVETIHAILGSLATGADTRTKETSKDE
jgi:hypothetical protein